MKIFNINLLTKNICFFLILLFPIFNAQAENVVPAVIGYFLNNFLIKSLVNGGYYSLAGISILTIIAIISKKMRLLFLSILFAIFGLLMVISIFEALQDFEWIPSS